MTIFKNTGLITKNFTNKLYRENKTIYAKWTAKKFTITFDPNKITASSTVKITKNKTFYAHWKSNSETIKLYSYNWSGTSSDCIDTKNKCGRTKINISGYPQFKVI